MGSCRVTSHASADTGYSSSEFNLEDPYELFMLPEDALEPHYYIKEHLGAGGFGAVYQATDRYHRQCAIKIQRKVPGDIPPLTHELKIYQKVYIDKKTGFPSTGIPRVYDYKELETHEFLVMEQCGDSLEAIRKSSPGEVLSKRSALMIGIQAVRVLETLHLHGVLHRDIKPANLVMGLGPADERTVHLLDFGLAHTIEDWDKYNFKGEMEFSGTDYFASVEALFQQNPTFSGDLQSLAYTILFLVIGELPWDYADEDTGRELSWGELGIQRLRWKAEQLCSEFPELTQFMKIICRLKRQEIPDYDHLVLILEEALHSMNCENNGEFEWLESMNPEATSMARVDMHGPSQHHVLDILSPLFYMPEPETSDPETSETTTSDPRYVFGKDFSKISWTLNDAKLMLRYRDQNRLMKHVPKPTKEYKKIFPHLTYGFLMACRTQDKFKKLNMRWKAHVELNLSDVAGTAVTINDAIHGDPASEVSDSLAGTFPEGDDYESQMLKRSFLEPFKADNDLVEDPKPALVYDGDSGSVSANPPSIFSFSVAEPSPKLQVPKRRMKRAGALLKKAVAKSVCWLVKQAAGNSISNLAQCGGLVF